MRTTKRTKQFKKDYKRVRAGERGDDLDDQLAAILGSLVEDAELPDRAHDHALTGPWKDFRDCHVFPDVVLIYRKHGEALELVRLGSHSELGL